MSIDIISDIATIVRNWIHYDNLATTLSKQATTARNLRDKFEDLLFKRLKEKQSEKAIIQISGGRLNFQEEKKILPITYERLQEGLHRYFSSIGKPDETAHIMGFLKKNRQIETKIRLKKTGATVPPPAPPL